MTNTVSAIIFGSLLAAGPVSAQQYSYPPAQYDQSQQYDQYPRYDLARQTQSPTFAPQQLDDLVAPIALYPDALLSQVLVASTYPSELLEANQWLAQNGSLQGQSRIEFAQQQNWDPSIQALVAFPDVVRRMTQDVRWTTDLGNAFLAQEGDVMGAVQRMRQRARQSGRLSSTPQQVVNVDYQYGEPVIEIQPADPQYLYVPVYNPVYIWGAPSYGYYPSLYYPSFGFGFGSGISIGAFFGGWGGGRGDWGWGPRWHDRSVFVNNNFFDRYRFEGGRGGGRFGGGNSTWAHDYNRGSGDRFRSSLQRDLYGRGGNYNANNTGRSVNRMEAPRSQAPMQQTQQMMPRGFSGSGSNYNGGYSEAGNRGRDYNRTQQTPQQPSSRAFDGGSRGNYGGSNSGNYGGNYSRNSGGGSFGRSFNQSQAPLPQAPVQQRFAAPQFDQRSSQPATPRGFSGGYSGNYGSGGNSRSFSQAPRSQAMEQQHFSGGSNSSAQHFSSPSNGGFSRSEGGHRR